MVATAPPVNGSDTGLVLNKPAKNELEFNYVPLGEKEPIKLTIALALRYLMPPSRVRI